MKLSLIKDQAIQARMAVVEVADIFDRLFSGIRFDEIDGSLLFAFKDEDCAAEIEDRLSFHRGVVATQILERHVHVVVAVPKVVH